MKEIQCWGCITLISFSFVYSAVTTCDLSQFSCGDGSCIDSFYKCDSYFDCAHGEDENYCEPTLEECEMPTWFRCNNNKCIASLFICDGANDCADYSDEQNCTINHASREVECSKEEFRCADKADCVRLEEVCDGHPDCADGSDETVNCKDIISCSDGFRCKNQHCIIKDFHCDGDNDCGDNSDEEHCDGRFHSPSHCLPEDGLFLCHDGVACLELRQVCDNFDHCFDKSDETGCSNSSACSSAQCSHSCHITPDGPKCFCPPGFKLDSDFKTCIDVNECEIFGSCGQRCENSNGSYHCYCDPGYNLKDDQKSCEAMGGEALLLFASNNQIRAVYLNSQVYFPVAQGLQKVTAVSHNGHYVFWANINTGEEAIIRSNEDGTGRKVVVDSGLGLVEDLEVDYVTGNVYFTDSEKKHIGVCTEDGDHCTVLVNEDVDKPRAIALLPRKGLMFWSDWGRTPMIATSGMDGSEPRALITKDIHWPNGLALDYNNDRIYWVDAKLHAISTVKMDGSDRREILQNAVQHPFAIAVFEDNLYWSDWDGHEVLRCHKFTGKNHTALFREKNDFIYGVHIYHSLLHPRVTNPCITSGCQGICLLAPNNSYSCACCEEEDLAVDKHTCVKRTNENEIAIFRGKSVFLFSQPALGKQNIPEHKLTGVDTISAIAYNSITHGLLLCDSKQRKIMHFDLKTERLDTVITEVGIIVSMSLDPQTNNLYVCDDEKRTLDLWSMNTKSRKTIIKFASGRRPLSVVVSAEKRFIFIAISLPNADVHVNRMTFDGSEVLTLAASSTIMGTPVHLAFDQNTSRLYWFNPFFKAIESINVDGSGRTMINHLSGIASSLVVSNSSLYWTIFHTPHLYKWTKESEERHVTIDSQWGPSMLLAALVKPANTTTHSCQDKNNGGCSHICIAGTKDEVSCACPDGLRLSQDNHTCLGIVYCSENQFKCIKDSMCISRISRCDNHRDCPSGEDEEECDVGNCKSDQFRCRNGQCIAIAKKCNYDFDCSDGSDELHCVNQCPAGNFPCGSGECISDLWMCDTHEDCKDGSDETVCREVTCPPEKFTCKSGTCIPMMWRCDGELDCVDGSDEPEDCRHHLCSEKEWKCKNNLCIDNQLKCDGYDDCGDDSDESECPNSGKLGFECEANEFLCSTTSVLCVPTSARCNYTSECPRGEDEMDCASCHRGEFHCKNKKCVSNRWVCDGENDCGDNSDEDVNYCNTSAHSGFYPKLPCDEFQCASGECIPLDIVCDGLSHCSDGSDEGGHCNTSCSQSMCQDICKPTPSEGMCRCHEGFILFTDGYSCKDVDECMEDRCSQTCTNTPGSFKCSCSSDYVLKNDRVTCKAIGERMMFVISGTDEVKKIPESLNHVDLVLYEPGSSITGLDMDSRKNILYWTSGTSNSLNIMQMQDGSRSYISNIGRPGKISLDWVTGNVYFIDRSSPNQIMVCHLVDRKCTSVLTIEEGAVLSNLVFDPISGYLFYTKAVTSGLHRPHSKIFRYDMTELNATLLASHDITWVSGMVVDHVRKDLYWADLHQQVIERITYNGTKRKIVLRSEVRRPEGLALFEDSLYWLTKGSGELNKCDIYGEHKGDCQAMPLHLYDANILVIHHEARQPQIHNTCLNVTCDLHSMCVTTHDGGQCFCEDGSLVHSGFDCSQSNLVESSLARARTMDSYDGSSYKYSGTSIFLTILLTVLVMVTIMAVYIYLQKNKSVPLVLESFHFRNPNFNVSHVEGDMHHRLLSPGQHEFVNHTAFVQHPNGDFGYLSEEKNKGNRRVINFQDCESDSSDHYEDVKMTTNLIP